LTQRAFCPTCQRFVYLDPSDAVAATTARIGEPDNAACPVCSVPLLAVTDDGEDEVSSFTAAS
jgi:hypothetical protein